jgi:hypothetical protein
MPRRRTFAFVSCLRSLDADCAPASCLRWSATPALGTWAAPRILRSSRGGSRGSAEARGAVFAKNTTSCRFFLANAVCWCCAPHPAKQSWGQPGIGGSSRSIRIFRPSEECAAVGRGRRKSRSDETSAVPGGLGSMDFGGTGPGGACQSTPLSTPILVTKL